MIEAIAKLVASGDYLGLLLVILLGAIAAPVATIWLLRRGNGHVHEKPGVGERLAVLEADVASLKDEFRNTVQRLEERLARQHQQTCDEVRELAESVRSEATSITGEFRLLREALSRREPAK